MTDETTPDQPEQDKSLADIIGEKRAEIGPIVLQIGPKNIEMEMRSKVQEALRQPMIPDDLEYMLIPALMPNSQGQPMPAMAITLALKAPVFGPGGEPQMIQATAILPSPWLPLDGVTEIVRQLTDTLLQARSEQSMIEVGKTAIHPGLNGVPRD